MYPDASYYKAGTASNKILQLREHFKSKSIAKQYSWNTTSNSNIFHDEQAIIDSLFNENTKNAAKDYDKYSSALYPGVYKQFGKKRSRTKNPPKPNNRGLSSANNSKKKIRNTSLSKKILRADSKKKLYSRQNSKKYYDSSRNKQQMDLKKGKSKDGTK